MSRPNALFRRIVPFCLAAAVAASSPLLLPGDAEAQSRAERKKQEILDYKAFQRDAQREQFGELANQKRQEAIAQLKQILAEQNLPPNTKAEMLMRLAELYFEQSKYEFNIEMDDFDKRYEKWFNLPEAQQKKTPEPKIIAKKSVAFTKKSIENYRNILQNYPNYPRVAEALFFLAFMLNDVGQPKEALSMYNKLVRTYPESDFVPDAWNAIGEYYFNNNNAFKALEAYKKAAEFPRSRIYTFALYKMGWCYYNVGEYDTAIDTMKDLLAETDRREREGEATQGISLRDEALRDLVIFFSEKDDLQAAKEFFIRYGEKKYYRKMLSKLGTKYMEQGKNELAVETYRELIMDNPLASDNPSHQNEIISAFQKRDEFEKAKDEIEKLVATYGRESRWSRENADNKDALKESERLIEKNLYDIAVENHQQALKRRSSKLLKLAQSNYAAYLDYFPTGQRSYDARYWYAEVLYKRKKYDQATEQYELVVAADPKGKHLKDAASNTIFAIDNVLKPMKKKLDKAAEKKIRDLKRSGEGAAKYAEVELDPWESRLIKACDTYAKALPEDDKTLNFLYKAALLLNDRNHFNDSNERFLQIVRASPRSRMAEEGVHRVLSTYQKIENWAGLNSAAREFYNNEEIGKSKKFKKQLRATYQLATFRIAEGQAAANDFASAAGTFDSYYREFGDSDNRDIALYNAGFYFGKAGKREKHLELQHEFVESFPDPVGEASKDLMLYERNVALLGRHYEQIADYPRAVEFFQTLAKKNDSFNVEGFTSAKDALYNAALYNEALGKIDEAVTDFRTYLKRDDVDGGEKLAMRMRIAHLYLNNGMTDQAKAAFKAIYSDKELVSGAFDKVMEAQAHYGRLLADEGDVKDKRSFFKDSFKSFGAKKSKLDANSRARFFAAEMQFDLLEPRFSKYDAVKMPTNTKKAKKALDKKTKGLAALEKEYISVLELKQGEWGIAALYRIGTLYGSFADALNNAPCPKKLDEDQCQIYKFGLQDRAYPLIDKAVEAFSSAREKSYELGLYTDFTNKALVELSRLRPEEYPPNAEVLPVPDYTSNPYTTTGFVR